MLEISHLPTVNATLNTISGILLTIGYVQIRQRKIEAHKKLHARCFWCVCAFPYLLCNLSLSRRVPKPFTKQGWIRPVYFTILISHIILAFVIVPFALRTLYLAWRKRFDAHRRIAKITFPIWLYVSVTGVIIYLMLYQLL